MAKQTIDTPAHERAWPTERNRTTGSERRVVWTVDLTVDEIAAIEASEMALGFEHLNTDIANA